MNREQAVTILNATRDDGTHKRPQSTEPDLRPVRVQMYDLEMYTFQGAMAKAALEFERRHGHWPFPAWFQKHQKAFHEKLQLRLDADHPRNREKDPPCKNWERNVPDGSMALPGLRRMWADSLHRFALHYPYLASPTAPCECRRCRGETKRTRGLIAI